MNRRVLFVDDEPRILEGLRRMLRGRAGWEASFAASAEEALAACAAAPVDVVVTDMRMPGTDGATLLARVAERSPETIRVVLSGQTDPEATARAVAVAHQFLNKPCDPAELCQVIDRICGLRDLLQTPDLRQLVGTVDTLPAVPQVWQRLGRALADPGSSAEQIGDIIQQDAGLAAKMLHLVNSSFFGQRRELTDVRQATMLLGTGLIRSLALAHHVFGGELGAVPAGFTLEREQVHAVAVARLAHRFLPRRADAEAAFTAGLLHDVGKLILARGLPAVLAADLAQARAQGGPLYRVELARSGVSHAEVGAYLLGLWGLPLPVVEAVAHHHQPGRVAAGDRAVLLAVHLANALVHEGAPDGGAESELDQAALEQAGWLPRVAEARELAAEYREEE